MESPKFEDPFNPGSGHFPPYLAGREDEQFVFRKNLGKMSVGKSPPAATVLYGPRGMGKTTLLSWFNNEVEAGVKKNDSIRVVWLTPDEIGSPSGLWDKLMPSESLPRKFIPEDVTAGVNAEGVAASATWKAKDIFKRNNQKILIDGCKKKPLILLIDEAHKMDVNLCQNLLNLHQKISIKSPFMLVLAGTPGLRNFLSTVDATFIERSKMIGLGRLDEQSAADAISKPFEEQGIEIINDALSIIVEDSQCYPYFLQEWGSYLWEEVNKENVAFITDEQVEVVKPNIGIKKNKFYDERRSKLNSLGLRPAFVAIANKFQDIKEIPEDNMLDIISENLSVDSLNIESSFKCLQTFIDNDFIWKSEESTLYEPGIPSFMTYILNTEKELMSGIADTIAKEKDDEIPDRGR